MKGCELVRADEVKVGDEVCFYMASANYVVAEVDSNSEGLVVHRFNNDTGSIAWMPGERVYVRRES